MHIVILSAGTGWYTDDLCRAVAERNHTALVLPYEGLVARIGGVGSLSSHNAAILGADHTLPDPAPSR